MMKHHVSNGTSTDQNGRRRSERNANTRATGAEPVQDVGFDDMNIPSWSDYLEARAALLRRLSRQGDVSRQ
jgi:hypothetical protein